MLLGASESIPVHESKLMIGKWQSIIMVRTVQCSTRYLSILGFLLTQCIYGKMYFLQVNRLFS